MVHYTLHCDQTLPSFDFPNFCPPAGAPAFTPQAGAGGGKLEYHKMSLISCVNFVNILLIENLEHLYTLHCSLTKNIRVSTSPAPASTPQAASREGQLEWPKIFFCELFLT